MKRKAKFFSAFLAVMLLSVAFSVSALAAGEKTGTTTLTAIVPDPSGTTCTITFDPNGGTGTMTPVTVNVGEKYTLPENGFTAPEGKVFDGWDKGQPGEQIDVTGDTVVTAQWKDAEVVPETCTVTFDPNGGTGTMAPVTVNVGEKYTLPENGFTAPEGKVFDGWDKGQTGEQIDVTSDTVITAQWKDAEVNPETYTVTFDPNGGTGTMAPVTVNVGEKYTLPENGFTAPEGKAFDGWDKGQPGEQIDIPGDTVITAQWKDAEVAPETCTVTFNAGGGTGSMAPVTVEKGTEYVLPANDFTAPSGKEFDRWDKGAVGTKITVNSDVTVTAQWKDKTVEPPDLGYDFKFTFTKTWQGDHEDSIDWVLYNPDGTVAHKKFNKKIVSESEWRYEAWFASGADYYIIETVPEGYKVRYENVGAHAGETDRCYNGGTIINYKVPKTGDRADLRLWLGCVLLGVSAVCGTLVCCRRKKENR